MDKGIQAARLADQIRDYTALWSRQDLPGYLFSFTNVTISPDKGRATLWFEVLNPEQMPVIVRKLEALLPSYQRKLSVQLGKRGCPRLYLAPDPRFGS